MLPLVVGIFCGGLGGSVFTWYVNRPKPTILTYRIATTTLSAPEASGLIPDLKVLIRGTPIQALYSHNIELLPRQGPYVDQADVALSFASAVRIYGIHLESPSVLHRIECLGYSPAATNPLKLPDPTNEVSSIQCMIKPILSQKADSRPFRVTVATNAGDSPSVLTATNGLELVQADQFSKTGDVGPGIGLLTAVIGGLAAMLCLVTLGYLFDGRKSRAELRELDRAIKDIEQRSKELSG